MRTLYFEFGVFIMIESNRTPLGQFMALLALCSKTAFVDVIALVAFRAGHRGILESRRQVTVLASGCGMTAF